MAIVNATYIVIICKHVLMKETHSFDQLARKDKYRISLSLILYIIVHF